MKYEAILFDLDGTLLPMDMKTFERAYFQKLTEAFPEFPRSLSKTLTRKTVRRF